MAKRTIKIKDYLKVNVEYIASAAITPGHLLELASATTVKVHANAGQNVLPMIALEDELQGNAITDAYAAADRVQCWIPQRGDVAYMILKNGENVSAGDFLESAGDGTLQKHTPDTESLGADSSGNITTIYTNQIVGIALEAVDMSDSSAADPTGRIKVLIS